MVVWWLCLQLFGLAALPVAARTFRGLPDRGWHVARPLGLLIVTFVYWYAAQIGFGNSTATVVGALAVVAAAAWVGCRRELRALRDVWATRRGELLVGELVVLAVFAAFVFVRSYVPSLAANEKPMELAMLTGTLRSAAFPPLDPWFAGQTVSYYYYGYVVTAALARVSGVPVEFAFNLMLATVFALAAGGAYGLGASLVCCERRRAARGLAAVALVLFASNLEPAVELANAHGLLPERARAYLTIKDLPPAGHQATIFPVDPDWWVRASRVVWSPPPAGAPPTAPMRDYTINEFPYFSFLIGDLHPHVLALPFATVALAMLLALVRRPGAVGAVWVGVGAVVFGAFGPLNTWDLPTYLVVAVGACALAVLRGGTWREPRAAGRIVAIAAALIVGSVLLYLPFYRATSLGAQASGLLPVRVATEPQHVVLFWGPIVALLTTFFVVRLWRLRLVSPWLWLAVGALAAAAALLFGVVAGALVPLVAAAVVLAMRGEPGEVFLHLLSASGLGLILLCEVVFVHDMFGGRTNTVFKLYYQAWLMLGLAGGAAAVAMVGELANWWRAGLSGRGLPVAATAWGLGLAVVFGSMVLYPAGATWSRVGWLRGARTLDGFADWRAAYPDDAGGIDWLSRNVAGSPVVLEAVGDSYQAQFGRVSRMTGLPTVLGWILHERQFRGSSPEVDERVGDVAALYGCQGEAGHCTPLPADPVRERSLLAKYRVAYVYVGPTERGAYGADADRFAGRFEVAYRNDGVTIYRVPAATP